MPTGAREGEEYFTPDITDIRVGYECECLWCCAEPREWKLIKITAEDNMNTIELPIEEAIYRVIDNEIRVPYITQEQIEAEGWKIDTRFNTIVCSKQVVWFDGINREIELRYDENKKILYLGYDCGNFTLYGIFEGECKDINTFRQIQKLLKIK